MNRIHFIRACWSDIILLESQGKYALIDTGFSDAFSSRIDPYLKQLGVEKLEFILITHFHRDHYGSLPALLDHYPVGKVYMKKFSGLNISTSSGREASDEYNRTEEALCEAMCEQARRLSELVVIDGSFDRVCLGDFDFRVFGGSDAIREMYEAPDSPYYQQIRFGENTNSVALFADVKGTTVYLGGDAQNEALDYPRYSNQNDAYARAVGRPVDLMKVPHHGCGNLFSLEALSILRPRYGVVTNWTASLYSQFLKNVRLFKEASPDITLLVTDRCGYRFTLGENGQLSCEEINRIAPISVEEVSPDEDSLEEFWKQHIIYLTEDGIISGQEDIDYFSGEEYRGVIRSHMLREKDRHHLVYFVREGLRIGAASYCIYQSEDGKCFILDYWVFPPFRGEGAGHHCFTALKEYTKAQGAAYYELNSEGKDAVRFWRAHGFLENGQDEWGMPLWILRPLAD